ncbi:MAG: DNA primase [Thermoleophilia bacterium]|nr:DNA primase [Thermoleophilia bacterium]
MALIRKSSIEQATATADMVDIVSARTALRRVGSRWVGRCPFHEERTPSFSVNAADKLFYCFGCGKGGDLISFVRESEGLDFAEAVEWLAARTGVQLEYEEDSPRAEAGRRRRERLLALLEAAAVFYSRHLWESSAGEDVRAYLRERGLREEVCRRFRLGLSPGPTHLPAGAHARGFSGDELVAAGLVNRRGNDYFSTRLVFPLSDARGRVLGFGARRLREDDPIPAKYVNSPESDVFHKASLLYGLHEARAAITKEDRAVVVEGYTDVLALHQAGYTGVVASMGTALTPLQLKELGRLTGRLLLCFDADAAGEAATLRGMDLAYREFREVAVVSLPEGSDPADRPDEFPALVGAAEAYPRYRVKLEIDRARSKEEAYRRVQDVVASFERNTEWIAAVEYAADRLDLPADLQRRLPALVARATPGEALSRKVLDAGERLERDALAGVVAHRRLLPVLAEISPEHFQVEAHRRLRSALVGGEQPGPELTALVAELDARAAAEGIDETTARELLLRLRERHLRREVAGADGERLRELQTELARVREAASALV